MSGLTGASLVWGGLTFYGDRSGGARYVMGSLDGWEGLPDSRVELTSRPQQHGSFDGSVHSSERYVRVSGLCRTPDERDAMLAELGGTLVFGASLAPLTITLAGRTLTADARLTRYAPSMSTWGAGVFGWAAEWVCPDPLRYGIVTGYATTFPVLTGGLEYDLYTDGTTDTGFLEYGDAGSSGRVLLSNAGTADSWPQFEITGPVDAAGFEITTVGTGARLRYVGAVPSGSVLVLDSATGSAVIDGTADRGGQLTYRDWAPVPAGGSSEFAFVPLGVTSAAALTATVRPAYW